MGRLRKVGLWSLAAVTLVAWIPYATCGSASKTAIKLVKPTAATPSEEKLPAASRREPTTIPLSVEDEDNFSGPVGPGQRPAFAPFPPGFVSGAPPRYGFNEGPDGPSDRYDMEEAPSERENHGMGFMGAFGPPKGFPDLSKLTDGEFTKMEAPVNVGSSYENPEQYGSYPKGGSKFRPFLQFAPQGGPQYYDDSDHGPSEGGQFGNGPAQSIAQPQNAPKRRPFRNSRPSFGGGRPSAFGGPGGRGPGGPGPYGAPEGLGGPGPYGAPDGLRGGGPGPYGGGSSRPFGSRPSGPGGPFGSSSDGPSSGPGPFGIGPEGPSGRPGLFGSDGPPSRPGSYGSDGPSSRPGLFSGGSDGPSGGPGLFGHGNSDGPSGGPGLFGPGGSSDGPGRPHHFGGSSDGPSSPRPNPFDGPSGGPYDNSDGPSRPGASFLTLDGPSRPGSFGGPSGRPGSFGGPSGRPGPYGAPGGGNSGPEGPGQGPFGSSGGRHESPSAFSFQNTGPSPGPGFRLSRGYPRYHPNQIQNDDFKESADNGDFTPFNGPPQGKSFPPRHQANFASGPDDYEQGPPQFDGPPRDGPPRDGPPRDGPPRGRGRPEFSPPLHHRQQQFDGPRGPFGPTHRYDSPKRPYVLKVSGLKSSKYTRELPPGPPVFYAPSPDMKTKDGSRKFQTKDKENRFADEDAPRAKKYFVKSRPKRDLETTKTSSTPCKTNKEGRCRVSSSPGSNKKHLARNASTAPRVSKTARRTSNITRVAKPTAEDPMLADGTQQTGFWDVPPAFGTFGTFKKQAVRHSTRGQDRHDEYEDEEEHIQPPAPVRTTKKNQTYLDTTSDEQRFFPSFPAPPSPYLNPFASNGGFGRPPLFPGPTANRAPSRFHPQFGPKYTQPHTNRGPGSAYPAESHDRYLHTNLLGSGNFEVVRGGTYYGDDDDGYHHTTGGTAPGHYQQQEDDDGYFHHNGHASPHGYRNNPSAGGGDFFANFRDFADINPPTRSFSHHHETVADAEPHGSDSHEHGGPKNILDKLESSSHNIEVHQPYTASSSRDSDPMMATF